MAVSENGLIQLEVDYEYTLNPAKSLEVGDTVKVSRDKKTFLSGTIMGIGPVLSKLMNGFSIRLDEPCESWGAAGRVG